MIKNLKDFGNLLSFLKMVAPHPSSLTGNEQAREKNSMQKFSGNLLKVLWAATLELKL